MVTGAAAAPGAMIGVVKLFASWMMSWFLVSTLFQMTRCPRLTVVGLGTNELLPLMPAMLMVASAGGVVGVGVAGLELPQAEAITPRTARVAMEVGRIFIMRSQKATAIPTQGRVKCRVFCESLRFVERANYGLRKSMMLA
jgi:hypothetical protein